MCNLFYSSLHHVLSKRWGGGLTFISSLHQIDSSTINGNVEFVHSQYTVFWRHKCQLSFCLRQIINIVIILE